MTDLSTDIRVPGSFRDPCGHVFLRDGVLYRTVTGHYRDEYDALVASGLFAELAAEGLLVDHEEVDIEPPRWGDGVHRVLCPERVPFVSYPFEWSFSQLKDAALLTLELLSRALDRGFVLKDASAYNVQFVGCRPVFIDTLSFERYEEGSPWVGYRQFCQHFLAPLALMARVDVRLGRLLRTHLDGVPLDLASGLLPRRTLAEPRLAMHVHAHARVQRRYADRGGAARDLKVGRNAMLGLVDSLAGAVRAMRCRTSETEWADYYDDTNYSGEAMMAKESLVRRFAKEVEPRSAWDLGANDGRFSRLLAEAGAYTVAFDIDPGAVEKAYLEGRAGARGNILPLVMDLMDPSPSLGFRLAERESYSGRGLPDLVVALALVHHIAITNNVPLDDFATLLASLAPSAIVEFVPKSDSQVRRLLASRRDIFPSYHREGFERALGRRFRIRAAEPISGSDRVLYLLDSRGVTE